MDVHLPILDGFYDNVHLATRELLSGDLRPQTSTIALVYVSLPISISYISSIDLSFNNNLFFFGHRMCFTETLVVSKIRSRVLSSLASSRSHVDFFAQLFGRKVAGCSWFIAKYYVATICKTMYDIYEKFVRGIETTLKEDTIILSRQENIEGVLRKEEKDLANQGGYWHAKKK